MNNEPIMRPQNTFMNVQIGEEHKVLDHGFIRVVDYMGDDAAVTQAARTSYGTGTTKKSSDRGLIRYLMNHRHTTPFEMCDLKIHVKLPIFVARQWIRHRTASVNEYSARYSILDNEFYIPEARDIQPQSQTNKQGREGEFPEAVRHAMVETIRQHSEGSYQLYEEMHTGWPYFDELGNQHDRPDAAAPHEEPCGMARETARMVLPNNIYTQWYWKVNLHNLLHFLSLRADPHAQMEIRVYADVLCQIVKGWCPDAYEAFEDYVMNAEKFSAQELDIVRGMAAALVDIRVAQESGDLETMADLVSDLGRDIDFGTEALPKRERVEFMAKVAARS